MWRRRRPEEDYPRSVRDTVSAFSNDSGGTLIHSYWASTSATTSPLAAGFQPTHVRDLLADACANEMEPPVRTEIEILDLDGGTVVVAEVLSSILASNPAMSRRAASTMD